MTRKKFSLDDAKENRDLLKPREAAKDNSERPKKKQLKRKSKYG